MGSKRQPIPYPTQNSNYNSYQKQGTTCFGNYLLKALRAVRRAGKVGCCKNIQSVASVGWKARL